ncbi:MAG: hypothetical protein ACJ0UT_04615 [Candidatus Latescibacterota bacterium]
MLNIGYFNWQQRLALLAVGLAVFAVSSLLTPKQAHAAEDAALVPEAFLLRCRARGLPVKRCREGFTRAKQLNRKDSARALLSKCRLTGRDRKTCLRLINASFNSPNSSKTNRVKAYCLKNNIKKHQCRALIADKMAGGTSKTQQLIARCKAVGLNELECKKRLDVASRRLGQ